MIVMPLRWKSMKKFYLILVWKERRENNLGITVTITEEIIARAIRRESEGSYEKGLGMTSRWNTRCFRRS